MFSSTFYRVEILRQLRNPYTLIFTLAMPLVFYIIFGANSAYGGLSAGNGNTIFIVMASMAATGTATAMSTLCSVAAAEVRQGWGRQIALTPLSIAGYSLGKLATALTFAALAATIVFVTGAFTGADADGWWRWLVVATIIILGGIMFGLYGLGVGLSLGPDSASALTGISITLFSFLGNVFIPLDGVMLDIARFTPMYGYVSLARWPIMEGHQLVSSSADPLWAVLLNIVVWTVLFAALARFGVRRSRRRG